MHWSKLFIPTLREVSAEAEVVSHQLLLRAGYVRQLAAGIYSYLFLAQRSLLKIEKIVREEMDGMGGQEMLLPALNPAEVWQESGRWDVMGQNLFRLKDRFDRDLCLAMTHEEVMTTIARGELRSYKQLPQIWYQIQTKFRDEPRPKSGLLRVRQFLMKDSYSFDLDPAGLDISFDKHYEAYKRIFTRCGLDFVAVEADSGAMGGSQSTEFMVASDAGEDFVVVCGSYAANLEKAVAHPVPPSAPDPAGDFEPEPVHTPNVKTIAEVAEFLKLPATSQMKSLVMMADDKPVLALVRGDHQLSETKFASVMKAREIRPALPHEIRELFGADPGSLGPVGVKNMRVVVDKALEGRRNMVAGANRDDYHLLNVTPGKDFPAEFADLRQVAAGDACIECGQPVAIKKTIEIGHIFKLGYKYSEAMGLRVQGPDGSDVTVIMGSYGIGIERILCAAIEQSHDANGMILPPAIAPFHVVITPVNNADPAQKQAALQIYEACQSLGLDALLDDRDERPGVKFKDAELIGIPFRVTVGKKLPQGIVELVTRKGKTSEDVLVADAAELVAKLCRSDWAAVREDFPALKNWTYLNTATLGLIPRRARAAMDAHFARRDELAHTDFYDWWDDMDQLRGLIAQMIHATADDIAFLPNASAALAIAKSAIDWKPGDELLTLEDEFPNQVYAGAGLEGVRLVETTVDQFWDRVTPRTRMVAISAVNYQTGLRAPWEAMIVPLRERGIFTYVDATQSFGALVNDVRGCQPDIYAVNCYKWACAPTGAAFACIHSDVRTVLKPSVIGWRSDCGWRDMENLRHGEPVFSDAAERFEGGMLPFPSLYGLKASIEWMLEIGPPVVEQRVLELAKACGGDGSSPIVALAVEEDARAIAARLREQRILVSARRGKLRISPHFYNNESDIQCFQNTAVRINPPSAHASPA